MSRRAQIVVSIVAVAVLYLPAVLAAAGMRPPYGFENRTPTPMPRLTGTALLHIGTYTQLSEFLTDRLPGRDRAITTRERISTSLFDETASESIVLGDDGWLYVADPLREPCISEAETARVRTGLQVIADRLRTAGKQFRLLVAPDKDVAYPGHLQERDRRPSCHLANSTALRGAIGGYAPGYSTIAAAARTRPDLYYRTDEHWTPRGALIGAQELVDSLQPGLFDLGAYRFEAGGDVRNGNLNQYQGLIRTEAHDLVTLRRDAITTTLAEDRTVGGATFLHQRRAGSPLVPGKVAIVHDSFGQALQPLVSPWLADVTWFGIIGGSFDPQQLTTTIREADTVVIVILERILRLRLDALVAATVEATGG